jgi:putative protease
MQQHRRIEIMAPAGNRSCLKTAILAGADAVYLGIESFNMRQGAVNFKLRTLPSLVKLTHTEGVKVYLTLNTLIHQNELSALNRVMDSVAKSGVDAVIAWDPAVMRLASERKIPVFASTQCSISNTAAMLEYHERFGIKRFVLARECPLSSIRSMRRELKRKGLEDLEIEVFAHGAMCVSISGRCYISEFMHGKSANRGSCTQPCRREYTIRDDKRAQELTAGPHYLLSPQDLCTLPFLEKVLDAGVNSLKIEGRNRSPEYVYAVTRAYRSVVNAWSQSSTISPEQIAEIKREAMISLESVYHRGLSSGFYHGLPIAQWTADNGNQATHKKMYIGKVLNFFARNSVCHIKVENQGLKIGETLYVQGATTGHQEFPCPELFNQGTSITEAELGQEVTMKIPCRVRRNDQIYRVVQNAVR